MCHGESVAQTPDCRRCRQHDLIEAETLGTVSGFGAAHAPDALYVATRESLGVHALAESTSA
jgi:hypothetical protein